MVIAPLSLKKDYWQRFEVKDEDLEFLYSYLLEVEKPQKPEALVRALVAERIRLEKEALVRHQAAAGALYYPKDHFKAGQSVRIPAYGFQTGKVVGVRLGVNPDMPAFEVIEVELENGEKHSLAAGLEEHKLNQQITVEADDPLLDADFVFRTFGDSLLASLADYLDENPDLVRIAGEYFPRALLVDINVGHLNLAEAVLDMMGGGPLPTQALQEQIDLPQEEDNHLNAFSLNLALQEDKRFDEVGPAGEVLWFLHRLEPEAVREAPVYLRFSNPVETSEEIERMLGEFEPQVIDELEPALNPPQPRPVDEATICLIYPHWRSGTLPLAGSLSKIFPTALESPRIQFAFVDGHTGEKFNGWVVRPNRYVYGLRDWYLTQGLIAGSILHVRRGDNPGEIVVRADKKRSSREWLRTAIIGSDGGVVFSMLKHNISAAVDERMAIVISDVAMLDAIWERNSKQRGNLIQNIRLIMGELAKLSPQSHVHAQELYAGVNILRRCPPGAILSMLIDNAWAKHLGNLYFRLDETTGGDNE
jgi:hypothetical protein